MLPVLISLIDDKKKLFYEFEKEAIPHMDALYNFALRMTGDKNNAGKLLEKTYHRAFGFFDKLESENNVKPWLFRIMRNIIFDEYTQRKKKINKFDLEETERIYAKIKAAFLDSSQLEKEIFNNLQKEELVEIVSSLPEDFKTVIILCDIENFSYEEISDFVDIPVRIVKLKVQKARKLIFIRLYKLAEN